MIIDFKNVDFDQIFKYAYKIAYLIVLILVIVLLVFVIISLSNKLKEKREQRKAQKAQKREQKAQKREQEKNKKKQKKKDSTMNKEICLDQKKFNTNDYNDIRNIAKKIVINLKSIQEGGYDEIVGINHDIQISIDYANAILKKFDN